MLTHEMLVPLAVFALLESGCREVWVTDRAAIGIEQHDPEEQVERLKQVHKLQRRFAYHGQFQDRNQHQMSGRVR
jgi:homoaconitase/3-isopropylmalate dehydratase large subunit